MATPSGSDSIHQAELCLWQFLNGYNQQPLARSNWALVMGCSDLRVAEAAAQLQLKGDVEKLLFSGGYGRLTKGQFQLSEAETFAAVAKDMGVSEAAMRLDTQASNSQENLTNARALLSAEEIGQTLVIVCRNIFRPRVAALAGLHLAGAGVQLVSPELNYQQYASSAEQQQLARHMMVGEIERLQRYPDRGWQLPVGVPEPVVEACQRLLAAGYNQHLPQ